MLLLLIAIVSLSPSSVAYATANISLDSLSTGLLHDGTSFEYISIINTGSFPATPEDMTIEINTAGDDLEIPGGIELGHCDMIRLDMPGTSLTDSADFVRLFSDGGFFMDSMDFADGVPDETTGDIVMWDDSSVWHCEYSIHRATVSYDYCENGLGGNNACGSDSPRFVMSSISVYDGENPAPSIASSSSSSASSSVSSSPAPASPPADPAPAPAPSPANVPRIGVAAVLDFRGDYKLHEMITITNTGTQPLSLDGYMIDLDYPSVDDFDMPYGMTLNECEYVQLDLIEHSLSRKAGNIALHHLHSDPVDTLAMPEYDHDARAGLFDTGDNESRVDLLEFGEHGEDCGLNSRDGERVGTVYYDLCVNVIDPKYCTAYYDRAYIVPVSLDYRGESHDYYTDEVTLDVSDPVPSSSSSNVSSSPEPAPIATPSPQSPPANSPMVLDPGNSAKDELIVFLQERNEDLEAENDSLRLILGDLLSYLGYIQDSITGYGIAADSP